MKAVNIGLSLLLSLSLFGFKNDTNIVNNTDEITQSPQVRIKEDTESPIIEFKDVVLGLEEITKTNEETNEEVTLHQITIEEGTEFDLTKYMEVSDNSEHVYTISFGIMDPNTIGTYEITLIAIDDWNNATEAMLEVKVVSEEEFTELEDAYNAKLEAERARIAYEAYVKRKNDAIAFASRVGANGAGGRSDIVNFAMSFLGTDYVYGGASPAGFDCSGFMQYVYGEFGINISRGAGSQSYNGYSVSPENIAPGDMIFFSNSYTSDVTHVGMYIGGGRFVHAANANDGVITSSVSGWVNWGAGSITDIRRVW